MSRPRCCRGMCKMLLESDGGQVLKNSNSLNLKYNKMCPCLVQGRVLILCLTNSAQENSDINLEHVKRFRW